MKIGFRRGVFVHRTSPFKVEWSIVCPTSECGNGGTIGNFEGLSTEFLGANSCRLPGKRYFRRAGLITDLRQDNPAAFKASPAQPERECLSNPVTSQCWRQWIIQTLSNNLSRSLFGRHHSKLPSQLPSSRTIGAMSCEVAHLM